MSFPGLNLTSIPKACQKCLETICFQNSNSTCINSNQSSIPSYLYPVLGTLVIIVSLISCTCCYIFKGGDICPTRTAAVAVEEKSDDSDPKSKKDAKSKSQGADEYASTNDIDEQPNSRFKQLKTIQPIREPEYRMKAVKSGGTTITGDVAFIAPRDEQSPSHSKSQEDSPAPTKAKVRRESSPSRNPPPRLATKSPLGKVAAKDRFSAGVDVKKEKEKIKEREREKIREDREKIKEKARNKDKVRGREMDKGRGEKRNRSPRN